MIGLVARALEQQVECNEPPLRRARHVLSVDLLQAQDVGRQSLKNWPQCYRACLERQLAPGRQVKALDVERGKAHRFVPYKGTQV